MVKIFDLRKSYGNVNVLNGVTLSIGTGEIHGLVGDNGAGKTTLFKCIAGLESSEGVIDGSSRILKNITGYLPTNPFFFSKMTGYEYLRLLCQARQMNYKNFDQFNLFELPLKRYADTYSTGMQKKLALMAILLQKNEFFILDEPFNGVDVFSNLIICDILLKLRSLNKTVLMSSHIFSSLQDTCDCLHYLKNGLVTQSVSKSGFFQIEAEMRRGHQTLDIIDAIYR